VTLEGLTVEYGSNRALADVSAAFPIGAVGLLGPNGAGKSTMIKALLGFITPATGRMQVLGLDVTNRPQEIRSRVGYMPENDGHIPGMNAVSFVAYCGELSGLPAVDAMQRAHEVLYYVGLGEARYREIGTYSSGMKQLVKLAQALVHGPRLLFLDEPTNALDPPARERMLRHIQEIRDQGSASIILSSHVLRDVERCCDEVLVLKDGRIAAYRDLVAERRSNRKFLEIELKGDDDGFLAAMRRQGAECAPAPRRGRNRFKMVLPEGLEVAHLYREAAERRVQIRRLSYKRDSLEEIFLAAMETGSPAEGTTDGAA
jgi:ABC-2 type transport system ATP-binding protein